MTLPRPGENELAQLSEQWQLSRADCFYECGLKSWGACSCGCSAQRMGRAVIITGGPVKCNRVQAEGVPFTLTSAD